MTQFHQAGTGVANIKAMGSAANAKAFASASNAKHR